MSRKCLDLFPVIGMPILQAGLWVTHIHSTHHFLPWEVLNFQMQVLCVEANFPFTSFGHKAICIIEQEHRIRTKLQNKIAQSANQLPEHKSFKGEWFDLEAGQKRQC